MLPALTDTNKRTLHVKTRRAAEAREPAPELTATHWIRLVRAAWMSVVHSAGIMVVSSTPIGERGDEPPKTAYRLSKNGPRSSHTARTAFPTAHVSASCTPQRMRMFQDRCRIRQLLSAAASPPVARLCTAQPGLPRSRYRQPIFHPALK